MQTAGKVVLDCAACLIAAGGFYDLCAPRLPSNLVAICGENEAARNLARELLRALGGCLIAIGLAVAVLANGSPSRDDRATLGLILLLVAPSEGINALSMKRCGSPFAVPLAFIAMTLIGVLLA